MTFGLPPEVLLVDHPVLPSPEPAGNRLRLPRPEPLRAAGRTRRQRLELAAQLAAAVAALGELELWPGRRALRFAGTTPDGAGALLPAVPRPLAPLVQRLGGGEEALRRLRDAAAAEIQRVCGLPAASLRRVVGRPVPDLGGWLEHLLDELGSPLPESVAHCLWAVQWRLPELPEEGEVQLWSVPHAATARRLAAATREALAARGRQAWWIGTMDGSTSALPPVGAQGVAILAGEVSAGDLESLGRWTRRDGCGGVVYGIYPDGWRPHMPPGFDGARLERHLVLVGVPPERAHTAVEQRRGRFHPLVEADRAALTAALGTRLDGRPVERGGTDEAALRRVLGLRPEGVPEAFCLLHTGLAPAALAALERRGGLVRDVGGYRAPAPEPLRADPLHLEIAALYRADDPRHQRHLVLGGRPVGALADWARRRLDELAEDEVWSVLGAVDPAELPAELLAPTLESALARGDLCGARRLLVHLPGPARAAWEAWCEVLDAGDPVRSLGVVDPRRAPRAAAVVAARALQRGGGAQPQAAAVLETAVEQLAGDLRRLLELDIALARAPDTLADRAERQRRVGSHPALRWAFLYRRGLALLRTGRPAAAATALRRAAAAEGRPGLLGLILLDLGAAELLAGRGRRAELPQLRAHRLLEAAGFVRRARHAVFNLAVADLDALRLERAGRRFAAAAPEGEADPALEAELARLDLARGDLPAVRRRLAGLTPDDLGLGVGETVHLLTGALALLEGSPQIAARQLEHAGAEGAAWRALADALQGRPPRATPPDGWGVARAARLVAAARGGAAEVRAALGPDGLDGAFALVLAERLTGALPGVDAACRHRARARLESAAATGWARQLTPAPAAVGPFLGALARVAEEGGFVGLQEDDLSALAGGLGVTGLELRRPVEGMAVWRWGDGAPGPDVQRGGLSLVPLGGTPERAAWQLLGALLGLLAPPAETAPDPDAAATGLWGVSAGIAGVRRQLRELGPTRFPVTLLGETGVGKEVAAAALHRLSGRRGELVPVNVTAIPAALLEAELFGAVRGAYTGADRPRPGLVDRADGGTLFLDEIGDLDAHLQAKLLRFLESGEVRSVGAVTPHQVDVRVVTATHRDLDAGMADGTFRRDLFYRIASGVVRIPPLRERREDIPVLRDLFVDRIVRCEGGLPASWSARAEAALAAHSWPGNVRELLQVVRMALLRARGGVVQRSHLPLPEVTTVALSGRWDEAIDELRRRLLTTALEEHDGNRTAAARALGISRQTLHHHLRELDLGGGKKRADRAVRGKKEEV